MAKAAGGNKIGARIAGCFASLFTSIHGYFFISAVLYLIAGAIVFASFFMVHEQMCNAIANYPCEDNVLMSYPDKSYCWRYAMNITYLATASDANAPAFTTFSGATQDPDCLDLLRASTSPLQMIAAIGTMQASADPVGSQPSEDCVKWNCNVLYTAAHSGSYSVLQGLFNPYDDNGTATYEFKTCVNTVDAIGGGTITFKPDSEADICSCMADLAPEWTALKANTAAWWSATTAGNADTYAALKEICRDVWTEDPDYVTYIDWVAANGVATPSPPTPAPGSSVRRLEEGSVNDSPTILGKKSSADGKLRADTDKEEIVSTEVDARALQDTATAATPASTASTVNDELPDYTVTDWSKCTCIQACQPGLKTRSVTCPSGQTCKTPEPPASEKCNCSHCADCEFMIPWLIVAGAFGLQGLLSMLLALAFSSIADIKPDDLISLRCCTAINGCVCKFLPLFTRFWVWVSLVCILYLVTIAVLPVDNFMDDCKTSALLKLVVFIMIGHWAFQLFIGLAMRANQRVPPWLYFSQTKTMKKLCCLCRRIGP